LLLAILIGLVVLKQDISLNRIQRRAEGRLVAIINFVRAGNPTGLMA